MLLLLMGSPAVLSWEKVRTLLKMDGRDEGSGRASSNRPHRAQRPAPPTAHYLNLSLKPKKSSVTAQPRLRCGISPETGLEEPPFPQLRLCSSPRPHTQVDPRTTGHMTAAHPMDRRKSTLYNARSPLPGVEQSPD